MRAFCRYEHMKRVVVVVDSLALARLAADHDRFRLSLGCQSELLSLPKQPESSPGARRPLVQRFNKMTTFGQTAMSARWDL